MAIFSPNLVARPNEHFVEEFMPPGLFKRLEEVVRDKYGSAAALYDGQVEWDLDKLYIDMGGSMIDVNQDDEEFVTFRFIINKSGQLARISMSR